MLFLRFSLRIAWDLITGTLGRLTQCATSSSVKVSLEGFSYHYNFHTEYPFEGPCSLGRLFHLDRETGSVSCDCQSDWLPYYYPLDGKCYEQNSLGPCPAGQYFVFNQTVNATTCNCFTNYVPDSEKGICVEKLTQADCPFGQLVTADSINGLLKCDCQPSMKEHYWAQDGQCYEHFSQGPCDANLLFRLDEKTEQPACLPPISRRKKRFSRSFPHWARASSFVIHSRYILKRIRALFINEAPKNILILSHECYDFHTLSLNAGYNEFPQCDRLMVYIL